MKISTHIVFMEEGIMGIREIQVIGFKFSIFTSQTNCFNCKPHSPYTFISFIPFISFII
jgi:hypothetical protein